MNEWTESVMATTTTVEAAATMTATTTENSNAISALSTRSEHSHSHTHTQKSVYRRRKWKREKRNIYECTSSLPPLPSSLPWYIRIRSEHRAVHIESMGIGKIKSNTFDLYCFICSCNSESKSNVRNVYTRIKCKSVDRLRAKEKQVRNASMRDDEAKEKERERKKERERERPTQKKGYTKIEWSENDVHEIYI